MAELFESSEIHHSHQLDADYYEQQSVGQLFRSGERSTPERETRRQPWLQQFFANVLQWLGVREG